MSENKIEDAKRYCVDCMDFITVTLYRHTIDQSQFKDAPKVRKVVNRVGRCVVFWCRISGAYYINNHKVYYLQGCKDFNR